MAPPLLSLILDVGYTPAFQATDLVHAKVIQALTVIKKSERDLLLRQPVDTAPSERNFSYVNLLSAIICRQDTSTPAHSSILIVHIILSCLLYRIWRSFACIIHILFSICPIVWSSQLHFSPGRCFGPIFIIHNSPILHMFA